MLQLIMGIAGSGKTTQLLRQIDSRAAAAQPCILLVPEQFSSSAEALAYSHLGDEKSAWVEVVSFRTLAERILKTCGGLSIPVLTEAGRAVYVRRAVDAVADQLQTFGRQRRSTAFCNLCAQALAELKTAGATPARLHSIAQAASDAKLGDLALVFDAYEALIAGSAADPEDRLALAAGNAGCGYLKGKACYIDSFDGFTPPEYEMISALMGHCDGLVVALCADGLNEPPVGPDLFTPVRRCAHRLLRLAGQAGIPAAKPVLLDALPRPKAAGIAGVNLLLATGEAGESSSAEGLVLSCAEDEWEELRMAAAEMHRLALGGMPYSRMAIVCRDIAAYESAARRQCALYDIPLFVDAGGTIEHTAPVAFVRAALQLLREGLSSRGVLALLKTGLCGYTTADIAALENYVFIWQPRAAEWRAPFEKNPAGLLAPLDEEAAAQLAAAEGLRARLVPHIEGFLRAARGQNAAGVSRQLYLLMDRFDAATQIDTIAQRLEDAGEHERADQSRRAWDMTMDLLDEMSVLVGGESLGADTYDELFVLLVRSTDFGQVPQTLECAVLTSADRMRLNEPDACFVVDLCEGDFPMQVGYSGLLTHLDRERLVEGGIEMPGSFENRVLLEDMFLYKALAAPRRHLYLSWPARRAGQAKTISTALLPIRHTLSPPQLQPTPGQLAATPAAAFDLLGSLYRDNSVLAASLHTALQSQPQMASMLALLSTVDNQAAWQVKDTAAIQALVGKTITLSATTVERYYACPFAYYMERVLRVKERRRAELSPMESGTFVHYILEQVLRQAGKAFATWDDGMLCEAANRCAAAFAGEHLPETSRRDSFKLGQITEATIRLLVFLRDAAAQSDFETDAVELAIGDGEGDIPPLEIDRRDGRRLRVRGMIDRVDVLHRDGKTWLCIIDYKTGDKRFSLGDVWFGQNMQMMIYLNALCKNGGGRYQNPQPAGVLYLCADPAPASGGRAGSERPTFRFDGLLQDDSALLRAMERDGSGVYIPVKYLKSGAPTRASRVAQPGQFSAVMQHVESKLAAMADGVYDGQFNAVPAVKPNHTPCAWCPYRAACRHEDGVNENEMKPPKDIFGLNDTGGEVGA